MDVASGSKFALLFFRTVPLLAFLEFGRDGDIGSSSLVCKGRTSCVEIQFISHTAHPLTMNTVVDSVCSESRAAISVGGSHGPMSSV